MVASCRLFQVAALRGVLLAVARSAVKELLWSAAVAVWAFAVAAAGPERGVSLPVSAGFPAEHRFLFAGLPVVGVHGH